MAIKEILLVFSETLFILSCSQLHVIVVGLLLWLWRSYRNWGTVKHSSQTEWLQGERRNKKCGHKKTPANESKRSRCGCRNTRQPMNGKHLQHTWYNIGCSATQLSRTFIKQHSSCDVGCTFARSVKLTLEQALFVKIFFHIITISWRILCGCLQRLKQLFILDLVWRVNPHFGKDGIESQTMLHLAPLKGGYLITCLDGRSRELTAVKYSCLLCFICA